MKNFSELGIVAPTDHLTGEKIKISKVLNREIAVINYKVEVSKFQKNKSGKCLFLQIELCNDKRVVFTGSDVLIKMIQQVKREDMPFKCTIVKEGEHFEFK